MDDPCKGKDKIGPCVGPGNGPGTCGICGRAKVLYRSLHLCQVCDLLDTRNNGEELDGVS